MSQLTITTSKDATLDSQNANSNNGAFTPLYMGKAVGRSLVKYHAVLEFDLSSVPGDATIVDAELTLTCYIDPNQAGGVAYHAYRMTRTWTEAGVTWNKYDGTNNWTTAGGDYTVTGGIACSRVGISDNLVVSGLADLCIDAIANRSNLLTLLFRCDDEATSAEGRFYFRSKEDATPANRPALVITYTQPSAAGAAPAERARTRARTRII